MTVFTLRTLESTTDSTRTTGETLKVNRLVKITIRYSYKTVMVIYSLE